VNLFITGASGFVGRNLINLASENHNVRALYRSTPPPGLINDVNPTFGGLRDVQVSDLMAVDTLIHCAGVSVDAKVGPEDIFEEVNYNSTMSLAKIAVQSGVKRFIYLSSIKVNGENSVSGEAFLHSDEHQPVTNYGRSKSNAEKALLKFGSEYGLEIVVIRPTMVYGGGVKGNFEALMKLVYRGVPLPFKSIANNKRSLVSVTNLCDLIITCVTHPNAVNQIFLVSDNDDLSTAQMIDLIGTSVKVPAVQFAIPTRFFEVIGRSFKKDELVNKLVGSLHVDISHTIQTLDWCPPQTVSEAFEEAGSFFLKYKNRR
jgi:UDP-glucose 4-epimerase